MPGPARGIDREQDGPRDQTAQKANGDEDLEEADEEVAVDGLVIQNVFTLEVLEILYPSKEARTRRWRLALLA